MGGQAPCRFLASGKARTMPGGCMMLAGRWRGTWRDEGVLGRGAAGARAAVLPAARRGAGQLRGAGAGGGAAGRVPRPWAGARGAAARTARALEAVHPAAYLDFLRDAPGAWAAHAGAGAGAGAQHPSVAGDAGQRRAAAATGDRPARLVHRRHVLPDRARAPGGAVAAAAGAIAAADEAARGRDAYALARPPGHHAYAARAGGHCYLNNAALAGAAAARARRARGWRCWTSTATTATARRASSGTAATCCSRPCTATRRATTPGIVGHADERGGGRRRRLQPQPPAAARHRRRGWLAAVDTGLRRSSGSARTRWCSASGSTPREDEPLSFLSRVGGGVRPRGAAIGRPRAADGDHPGGRLRHRRAAARCCRVPAGFVSR